LAGKSILIELAATFMILSGLIRQNKNSMKYKRRLLAFALLMINGICDAQDSTIHRTLDYDPDKLKLIPDKVFEFGIPLLFLFLLLSTIVSILKNRADQQLKLKMVDKGIADETLIQIFKESNAISKLQPLKYFLLCSSLGISFIIIHFCKDYLVNQSGYFALGIILLFTSIAFLIYYRILQNRL
jgi:hypothetical protein